jgi:hypothetical protein
MSKYTLKSINIYFYLLVYSISLFLLTLSFLQIKTFFMNENKTKVLSAKIEAFDEEEYWLNFLELNPSYFPGYVELVRIQTSKGKINEARQTILKAKELNPNSPIIMNLEQLL